MFMGPLETIDRQKRTKGWIVHLLQHKCVKMIPRKVRISVCVLEGCREKGNMKVSNVWSTVTAMFSLSLSPLLMLSRNNPVSTLSVGNLVFCSSLEVSSETTSFN